MSTSLASASINDLASSSINSLATSTLDATSSGGNSGEGGSGTSGSSTCPWSSSTVTSIQNTLSSLSNDIAYLKTELAKVTARMPASGTVATSANITSAPTTSQIASAVWSASSREITGTVTVNNAQAATFTTATGFATPSDVTIAKDAIITRGNLAWTTATGFATPFDLPSNYATASAVSAIQTSIESIPTATYTIPTTAQIASAVWGATSKEITGDVTVSNASITSIKSGLSTFDPEDDVVTVNSTQAAAFTNSGTGTTISTSDIATAVWNYGNSSSTLTNRTIATNGIASAVWNENLSSYSTAGSAGSKVYSSPDASTLVSAILDTTAGSHTTTGTIGAKISAQSSGNVDTSSIAQAVWTYGDSEQTRTHHRSITSNALVGGNTLALSNQVSVTIDSDDIEFEFPTTSSIAQAVWNFGQTSGSTALTTRSLGTTVSVDNTAIASAVWNSNTRTLSGTVNVSSASIEDIQDGLATSSSITSVAGDVSSIKAKTNNLPANTANTLSTLQNSVSAIPTTTYTIPSDYAKVSDITALQTHGDSTWVCTGGTSGSSGTSSGSSSTPAQIAAAVWANTSRTLTSVSGLGIAKESTINELIGSNTCFGSALGINDSEGNTSIDLTITIDSNNKITSIR